MKRQVHKAIDFTLTAVGILIILGAVFAYKHCPLPLMTH